MKRPDRIVQYQLDHLEAEADFVLGDSNRLAFRIYLNPVFRFLTRHLQNFSWTVTRLLFLGHLHDGTRPHAPLSSRPVLKAASPPQKTPRILIDATQTLAYGGKTGIQRVVREIATAAAQTGDGLAVIIEDGRFVPYFRHPMLGEGIGIEENDILLLFDACWYKTDAYLPVMAEVSRRGGRIVLGIHDLIPLHYPHISKASHVEAFRKWLACALPLADAAVAVSRSVAIDVCDSLAGLALKPGFAVGWHHLGADFAVNAASPPSRELVDLCERGPFFLTVGIIEPRKAHVVALSAFEKLWEAGSDVRYMIIGPYSWGCHSVRQRILEHPEFGRRLFWLDHASDADLRHAYRNAVSLVYPSFAEGFGLPLIEAARHGLPVIASDIPVFREIGGDAIAYFEVLDPNSLADRVGEALKGKRIAPSFPILSWQDAARGLLKLVRCGDYQFSLAAKPARAISERSAIG